MSTFDNCSGLVKLMGIGISKPGTKPREIAYAVNSNSNNYNEDLITENSETANTDEKVYHQNLKFERIRSHVREDQQSQACVGSQSSFPNNTHSIKLLEVFIPRTSSDVGSSSSHEAVMEDSLTDEWESLFEEQNNLGNGNENHVDSDQEILDATQASSTAPVDEHRKISRYLATYIEADCVVNQISSELSGYWDAQFDSCETEKHVRNLSEQARYSKDRLEILSKRKLPIFFRYSHNYYK